MADKVASFVENVNTVANATVLATGDVLEDTQIARDEAQDAAQEAKNSAYNADASEELAQAWANKQYNNPVENGQFSSYHWSVVANENAGGALIDDASTSTSTTWSSSLIASKEAGKSDTDHLHSGVYEPAFAKNNAFNKTFTNNGIATTVARGDHTHSYEPEIGTKGTAFNKNFGTASGTVAEGSHLHSGVYMPNATQNTAYNKNFVADTLNPLSTEVPRGNHGHPSSKISYDNTGNTIISSSTSQGAIGQLDAYLGQFSTAERCALSAGMTNPTEVIAITDAGVGAKLTTAMTVSIGAKNALYSGGDLVVNYPEDPEKLIEGWISVSATITMEANTEYAMAIWLNDTIVDNSFRAQLGSTANTTTGDFAFSIDGFGSNVSNGDRISVALYNMTSANDITVLAHNISFAGVPEGAIVASGTTVAHTDTTGRDVDAQHPTSSIYQTGNVGINLDTMLDGKQDLVIPAATGNLASLDALGNIVDSGHSQDEIDSHMDLVPTPTLDNLVAMTTEGDSKDAGVKVSDLAPVAGNSTQVFAVATSVGVNDAVNQAELSSALTNYALDQDLTDHEAADNPHGLTATDVGAAATSHTHAEADVTGLTDKLNDRYTKVTTPATDNLVLFETGGLLKDSGIADTDIVQPDSYATSTVGGTIKIIVIGTDGYITTDGSTPGP